MAELVKNSLMEPMRLLDATFKLIKEIDSDWIPRRLMTLQHSVASNFSKVKTVFFTVDGIDKAINGMPVKAGRAERAATYREYPTSLHLACPESREVLHQTPLH